MSWFTPQQALFSTGSGLKKCWEHGMKKWAGPLDTFAERCHGHVRRWSGWWFGTLEHLLFFHIYIYYIYIGNFIIPTDVHSITFQRGRSTTNQWCIPMLQSSFLWGSVVIVAHKKSCRTCRIVLSHPQVGRCWKNWETWNIWVKHHLYSSNLYF